MNLLETLHDELNRTLNTSIQTNALEKFTDKVDELKHKGLESGILDGKKFGSSRTVYETSHPTKVTVDGIESNIPTVLKIVHKNPLDVYNDTGSYLGIHQNKAESSLKDSPHAILRKTENGYETNVNGVLAPVLNNSKNNTYIEMAKVEPFSHSDFAYHTMNREFPSGLHFAGMYRVVRGELNNDMSHRKAMGDKFYDSILNHKMTKNVINALKTHNISPNDIDENNFGIFVHPITKEKFPVISDYGMTPELEGHYKRFQELYHKR